MNLLTLTRLLCNIALMIGAIALLVLALIGQPIRPVHLWAFGALAVLGGAIQFAVSVLRPKTIRPAWDEQTVAAHRGSYQFGYWAALIGFWGLLASGGSGGSSGGFLWLGVVLICAPSAWMVLETLRGRAG